MLLELDHIGKSFGAEPILEDICLTVYPQDRIGLLGVNGAGKSTLLRLICGELEPDVGELSLARGAEIGYLRQNGALDLKNTIAEEVSSVFDDIHAMGEKLETMRQQLSSMSPDSPGHRELMENYDALNAAFESKDGYTLDVKINTVLTGMGFGDYDRSLPIEALSGGEKTRLAIAKLLLKNPQLLILDEPTNHLDFATLGWLEEYLHAYKGALIVVSHDRYFLDNVVSDICELERRRLTRYKGGYSQFIRVKQERLEQQRRQYERQQEKIEKLEDYVARNLARATTAGMAKSRIHMLEHMDRIDKPQGELKVSKIRFSCDTEPYKDVLIADNLSVSVGEGEGKKELCHQLHLHIQRGEKVAIIGQNGVGKSSLLKALQGIIPGSGRIKWGTNVKISYFEQENRQLRPDSTVIDELMRRFPRKTQTELRTLLGSLLLSGDDIYKRIRELSGGERAKVAFAIIMLERANVLILDEPSNHLDYVTKEVLDEALVAYPGTLLMVSHDRYLLNRVPSRIMEMFPDRMESYDGGYDYYVSHKRSPKPEPDAPVRERSASETQFYRSKAQRSEQAKRRARIASLEREIAEMETEITRLQEEIASPQLSSDFQKLQECCEHLEEVRQLLNQRMEEWVTLTEEEG